MIEEETQLFPIFLDPSNLAAYVKQINERFFQSLFVVCNAKEKKFEKFNLEEYDLNLKTDENLFSDIIVKALISTVPKKTQTEEACVGLAFCLLFKLYPEISEIETYQGEGEGYDYVYRLGDKFYKIEMSGLNSNDTTYFTSRISTKRTKFMEGKYWDDKFEKEEIFIADFYFNKYTYWDSKEHDNYIRGGKK
ncbi:hypothetical protein [Candidatus Lokiarchaeum ossiferum]|uniref:hypothetical protein n=1 Tax=Candidatus Lokiarchaeum ossiferum TaxID=2951803 RepID=UPI00352EDD37